MKFSKLLVVAIFAIPTLSFAQSAYIGLGIGGSKYDFPDFSPLTVTGKDDSKTGYKIFGGYEFNKNFGVELGYVDLGKARVDLRYQGVNAVSDFKSQVVYVAGTAKLPLGDFALGAKLGVGTANSKANIAVGSTSVNAAGSKTSLMGGVGAYYNVTKNVIVGVEYESFGKVAEDVKASMWNANVRFSF